MGSENAEAFRIVHVSDIHFWRYALNPAALFGKRLLGMGALLLGRARRFRLERVEDVVRRVLSLEPDHILITGDLTTTALPVEFRAAKRALGPWLRDRESVTILPGNHDRYTVGADRGQLFERYFGEFAPEGAVPWLRFVDPGTAILGLDPTRASLSARGKLPRSQLNEARALLERSQASIRRLLVACHYPTDAPAAFRHQLAPKRLIHANELEDWLSTVGPHLYCCGHVHVAWAFRPPRVPNQLCLNAGAPLLHDPHGHRPPGFLEILLAEAGVTVHHHWWRHGEWKQSTLHHAPEFFR